MEPDTNIAIPPELVEMFGKELRVVIRHPWIVGIPVPERLLKPEMIRKLQTQFDLMAVPKSAQR